MKIIFTLLTAVLFVPHCFAAHKSFTKQTRDSIDKLIQAAITNNTFPGAVVLIAHNDQVLFRKAYGYSEITPCKVKMTVGTLFDVASMTKCVATAPAIMKLVEEGKVRLSDPVKTYIPEFAPR